MRKPSSPITQVTARRVIFDETAPITHNEVDAVFIFYTSDGRLVQSESYDEAYAKWLLTKETD